MLSGCYETPLFDHENTANATSQYPRYLVSNTETCINYSKKEIYTFDEPVKSRVDG